VTRMAVDTTSAAHLVDVTGVDVSTSVVIEWYCVVKLAWCDVLLWIDERRGRGGALHAEPIANLRRARPPIPDSRTELAGPVDLITDE
jgi:hypothetical protein